MSGLAKVFVGINFVLAIVFLSAAGMLLSTSADFKEKYDNEVDLHEQTKTRLEANLTDVEAQLSEKSRGYEKLSNDLGDAENAQAALRDNLEQSRDTSDKLSADLTKLREDLANLEKNLTRSQDQLESLTQQKEAAQNTADGAVRSQMAAEDELTRTKAELSDARDRIAGLEQQVTSANSQIEELQVVVSGAAAQGFDPNEIASAPPISGVIRAVDNSRGVFVLSVGSDDGVTRGTKFFVFRGNEYLGEVYADQVQADLCSAVAREAMSGVVQANDQVTTRL